MEAHIVEGGVVKAILVFLHLALDATDSTVDALLAPVAVLPPLHAGPLQHRVAAAAELDVVHGCVVTEETLMGLHANLEGGEHACGAVHGMGPLTEAGRESEGKKRSGKDPQMETLELRQGIFKSKHLICLPIRSGAFDSPQNMMGSSQSAASCCSLYFSNLCLTFKVEPG